MKIKQIEVKGKTVNQKKVIKKILIQDQKNKKY